MLTDSTMHDTLAATSRHMQARSGAEKAAGLLDGLLRESD